MTREEYIEKVKVKLEEISPFDEPNEFIAGESDPDYEVVKPIVSYIKESLDEATYNCLLALPLSLLHADIEKENPSIEVSEDGVAKFTISANTRFVRFRHPDLLRDITSFITSEDAMYLIQQNKYTRGGQAKPVAVVSSDVESGTGYMEIYSLAKGLSRTDTDGVLLKINLNKKVGEQSDFTEVTPLVNSSIADIIVLECAAIVADILGNAAAAQVCRQEQITKIQSVLQ